VRNHVWPLAALAVVLALCVGLAHSQQRTLAIYGDWTVSCTIASGSAAGKSCGLAQVQRTEGQANPIGLLSLGRYANGQPLKILFEIRADAWIPTGVKLITSDSEISATFKWCAATHCLADTNLTSDDINSLRTQRQPGRIVYKNVSQADVSIPVSFNGFSEALDALQKE
jgi:invasion protein IalB